jgi:enamine deaminase RidA (YjgF/YER057c/UK114 family)
MRPVRETTAIPFNHSKRFAMNASAEKWIVLFLVFLPLLASADVVINRFNPKGMSQPIGYSQVVTIEGTGKTILLGGKAGIHADDSFPKTLEEQTKLTFDNIRLALESAGATPADVVEIQIFIVDLANIDPTPVYQGVRNFFPAGHKPVSMVIGVSALAYPGLLVEINVRAVVAK